MYSIEQNVPVPKATRSASGTTKYPWELMSPNDSFMVDGGNVKSLRTTAYVAGKRLGMKFVVRTVEGGARVWRVA